MVGWLFLVFIFVARKTISAMNQAKKCKLISMYNLFATAAWEQIPKVYPNKICLETFIEMSIRNQSWRTRYAKGAYCENTNGHEYVQSIYNQGGKLQHPSLPPLLREMKIVLRICTSTGLSPNSLILKLNEIFISNFSFKYANCQFKR